jgi:hypothetical protein
VLLAISDTLANSTDHIAGFADSNTHLATLVSDNHKGPETHLFPTFYGLGDAANLNDSFLPFGITLLASAVATAAATSALSSPATALLLLFLLAFRSCGDVIWGGLGVGLGHGESRDQN